MFDPTPSNSTDGTDPRPAESLPQTDSLEPATLEPDDLDPRLAREVAQHGGPFEEPEEYRGSVGRTTFDLPSSKDNLLSVLVRPEDLKQLPSQALVKIGSGPKGDGRVYHGIVVEGPFHEPDGLRADAPVIVMTAVRGAMFMPRYHGRVMVEVLGEVIADGRLAPPRHRPLPNSPVHSLGDEVTARVLGIAGDGHDVVLGTVIGHDDLEVRYPSAGRAGKAVLPRHTGVLGTTGGGKSTTVSGEIYALQRSGVAVVLLDTEGEYARINEPTEDPDMIAALERRGQSPEGVPNTRLYHLVGRAPSNPSHPDRVAFSLPFDQLAPEMVMEVLDLTPAQQGAYQKAYEVTRSLILALKLYGTTDAEKRTLSDLDELERGFPTMTLSMVRDVVELCARLVAGDLDEGGDLSIRKYYAPAFACDASRVVSAVKQGTPKNTQSDRRSWFKVLGALNRLERLKIFDSPKAPPLDFAELTEPGRVSIIDLGDTDSPQMNNLAIAELLRGMLEQQDRTYEASQEKGAEMNRVVVVIEEAHEFLSAQRIGQMPTLAAQVNRIARRGRKRWLGLMFVTQLPQHLPDEVLGLINNYILHKITDSNVISRLKRSVGSIDESLWRRLPSLSAGQAIVKMESMTRPLLVAIDPTPCKLRMID